MGPCHRRRPCSQPCRPTAPFRFPLSTAPVRSGAAGLVDTQRHSNTRRSLKPTKTLASHLGLVQSNCCWRTGPPPTLICSRAARPPRRPPPCARRPRPHIFSIIHRPLGPTAPQETRRHSPRLDQAPHAARSPARSPLKCSTSSRSSAPSACSLPRCKPCCLRSPHPDTCGKQSPRRPR